MTIYSEKFGNTTYILKIQNLKAMFPAIILIVTFFICRYKSKVIRKGQMYKNDMRYIKYIKCIKKV